MNDKTGQILDKPIGSPYLESSKETSIDSINIDVQPNIKTSNKVGWSTFTYPTGEYSFDFPSSWKVKVLKNRYIKEEIYDVNLIYSEEGKSYQINFMTGGRGGPRYEYEKVEYKTLGGMSTRWDKMYLNGKLFEAVVSFPEKNFENYFVGIYIYFPMSNQVQIERTIEEIITSLREN
ncbi:MAG: hypothetical protein WD988_02685 [Candidatus Curtissbacteria bacterium]